MVDTVLIIDWINKYNNISLAYDNMEEHESYRVFWKRLVIFNENDEEKIIYITIRYIFLEQLLTVRNNMKKQWNTIKLLYQKAKKLIVMSI